MKKTTNICTVYTGTKLVLPGSALLRPHGATIRLSHEKLSRKVFGDGKKRSQSRILGRYIFSATMVHFEFKRFVRLNHFMTVVEWNVFNVHRTL